MTVVDEIRFELESNAAFDLLPTEKKYLLEKLEEMSGTQTATVTTDPNTFITSHTFDLGSDGPHIAQVKLTGIQLTRDGETFGNIAGTIYVEPHIQVSATDGDFLPISSYTLVIDGNPPVGTFEVQSVVQPTAAVCLSARYLRVMLQITSNDGGLLYAGANHPTAQTRIDLIHT